MPRNPAQVAAPVVELIAQVGLHTQLQVVAGNALVEHGGALLPGVKHGGAGGHRPPHTPRTREVIGGASVVDTAGGGGRNAAFDALQRGGNVKVSAV